MNLKSKGWLISALLAALLLGFGAAKFTDKTADHVESANDHAQGDSKHADEEGHEDSDTKEDEGTIGLSQQQIVASGIQVVAVARGGGHETRLSGRVEPAIGARASVAAVVSGRVERVLVAPGSAVSIGSPLAYVISGEAATFRAGADAASAQAEAARLAYERDRSLVEQGVVARQEVEASRARSLAADATARAAKAQVAAIGTPDARGLVTIVSPVAGVVGSVQVTPGGVVAAGNPVATVSDPDKTELVFTAPPALATQVSPGMQIEVNGPDGNFRATVIGAAADVSEQSGVAIIRAKADTGQMPPAGSPVAGIVISSEESGAITVPADAVQTVDGRSVVFVTNDAGFRATPILTGRRAGGHVEVLGGLTGQERVAGMNAFLLKAELAKGEAEHGH